MKTQWYKGLESDAKDEIISHYKSAAILRRRLTEMLNAKIDSCNRESLLLSDYETANWAFKQADSVGYRRALSEIISLLD